MNKWKRILIAIVALLFLLILIPFTMVVARNCDIQVVNSSGKPWPDVKVSRGWAFGFLSEKLESKNTGSDGLASFDSRVERHSLLGRCLTRVANVVMVHGNAHINDEYLVYFPEGFTAQIDGEASFKWVYEPGHFAKIDLRGMPRLKHYHFKFTIREKSPLPDPTP